MLESVRECDILKAARQLVKLPDNFCGCTIQLPPVEVRDQKDTGRCWIEAGLGDLEYRVMRQSGRQLPRLSSEYLAYHDLRWKVHVFLRHICLTADQPVDSALLSHWLGKPVQDAGQWAVFRRLVEKHGVMPQDSMPHSVNHENSRTLIAGLCQKLRYSATFIRTNGVEEASRIEQEVYKMIDQCLGVPPVQFCYERKMIAPLSFYHTYAAPFLTDDDISFICIPDENRPFEQEYRVKWLYSETESASCIRHYNIPLPLFCRMAAEQLRQGMPVWFGADAEHFSDKQAGIFDTGLYQFEALLHTPLVLPRGAAALYRDSAMTHAMLLWGFSGEVDDVSQWCVRNSFGTAVGQNGYAYMSGEWFKRYVYQIVIRREIAEQFLDHSRLVNPAVHMLEPWDSIGCLAGGT